VAPSLYGAGRRVARRLASLPRVPADPGFCVLGRPVEGDIGDLFPFGNAREVPARRVGPGSPLYARAPARCPSAVLKSTGPPPFPVAPVARSSSPLTFKSRLPAREWPRLWAARTLCDARPRPSGPPGRPPALDRAPSVRQHLPDPLGRAGDLDLAGADHRGILVDAVHRPPRSRCSDITVPPLPRRPRVVCSSTYVCSSVRGPQFPRHRGDDLQPHALMRLRGGSFLIATSGLRSPAD
jgi:hypothetical protein